MNPCAYRLLSLLAEQAEVEHEDYPQDRLTRPMTLPARRWSVAVEPAYAYESRTGSMAAFGALEARVALSCDVEVGLKTWHAVEPFAPLAVISPSVRWNLFRGGLAFEAVANVPVMKVGQTYTGGISLGLPFKHLFGPSVAFVGLMNAVQVGATRYEAIGITDFYASVSLPVGLLFQPAEWLSVEVIARPTLGLPAPAVFMGGRVAVFFTFPRADVFVAGDADWRPGLVRFITTLGVVVRL